MVDLGRFGLLSMVVLVGCSESDERWGGQITETDGVLRVQNPSVPFAGPGAITARPLWRSSGPLDTDYWEAPNWVHADEIEALVSEMAATLAEDGLPSGVIQQQADYLRTRSRAKFRFRDLRFDPSSEILTIWEQNPEDFGSGNASLHVLSLEGIYLGVLEFDLGWAAFDLKGGVLYALSRNPVTDLVTLQAYSISVPGDVLERAHDLYSGALR